jgi:hypothetical protein
MDFTVDAVTFTKTFDRSNVVGLGCEKCINGYSGFVFAKEDMWLASKFSSILSDAYADHEEADKMASLDVSPYKVANQLYRGESSSLAKSLVALISQGQVQIEDAQEVLG